jgi:hypothetical protein
LNVEFTVVDTLTGLVQESHKWNYSEESFLDEKIEETEMKITMKKKHSRILEKDLRAVEQEYELQVMCCQLS